MSEITSETPQSLVFLKEIRNLLYYTTEDSLLKALRGYPSHRPKEAIMEEICRSGEMIAYEPDWKEREK